MTRGDPQPRRRLGDAKRLIILETLERHEGDRSKTAEELGLTVAYLVKILREYREEGHRVIDTPRRRLS